MARLTPYELKERIKQFDNMGLNKDKRKSFSDDLKELGEGINFFSEKRKQCCGCFKTFYKPEPFLWSPGNPMEIKTDYVCPYCESPKWKIV